MRPHKAKDRKKEPGGHREDTGGLEQGKGAWLDLCLEGSVATGRSECADDRGRMEELVRHDCSSSSDERSWEHEPGQ